MCFALRSARGFVLTFNFTLTLKSYFLNEFFEKLYGLL